MARPTGRDLRTELIDEATAAIQTRGTSFSFNRLADRLGVRAPSLHHHFRRKDDLIDAAAMQYIESFEAAVAELPDAPAIERLHLYIDVFTAPARDGRFCLCGALTADWENASASVRARISDFFDGQVRWVASVVEQGRSAGDLRADLDANVFARGFIAALEGALLLARTSPDVDVAAPGQHLLVLAQA